MIETTTVLTVLAMACVTYGTRACGYLLLRDRRLSRRAAAVMDAAPGCVLISLIAPYFASSSPAQLIALAATILAASRLPMLGTVLIGVVCAGILRQVLA